MTVQAILALKGREVVTLSPDTTLTDAARLLHEHRIGAAVVTSADRKVVGILSERDIIRVIAERGAAALVQPVSSAMTHEVFTCGSGETVPALMQRMTVSRFRHVPIVEQERLAGIVSIGDVVKYRLEEMERESKALREYILTA